MGAQDAAAGTTASSAGGPSPAELVVSTEGPKGLFFTGVIPARAALRRAEAAGNNVLGGTTLLPEIPEGLGLALNVVKIDSRDSADGGEVYPIRGGSGNKVGLGKVALYKLAAVAGLNWSSDQSGRMDAGSDDRYCHWRAVGWLTDPATNRIRWITAEKVIDIRPGSSLYQQWLNDARKKAAAQLKTDDAALIEERAVGALQRRLDEFTPHLASQCETKAQLRCIRSGLGLHTSYTKAQVDKPFVVPVLVAAPETIKDPALRSEMIRRRTEAVMGLRDTLYGQRSQLPSQGGVRVDAPLPPPHAVPHAPTQEALDEDDLVDE